MEDIGVVSIDKSSVSRKRKFSDEIATENSKETSREDDILNGFSVVRVLNENAKQKSIFVQGRFRNGDDRDAVLIVEKTPFGETGLDEMLQKRIRVAPGMQNDIYKTFQLYVPPEHNGRWASCTNLSSPEDEQISD